MNSWADALTINAREGGCVVTVHGLLAVGVHANGRRELLGFEARPTQKTAPVDWALSAACAPAAYPGWGRVLVAVTVVSKLTAIGLNVVHTGTSNECAVASTRDSAWPVAWVP